LLTGSHARRLVAHPAIGTLLAGALTVAVVCVLVGGNVLLHPGRSAVGFNPASDFQIMTWSLEWWPWAIGRGVDPLHTHLLWPPGGFPTLWMTTIPAPAFFALPLTVTAGPLVAYNVLMLLAPGLAAAAAFLLCRELNGRFFASLVGGLLFGLSPYMLGHTLSQHLDLTFVFPLPLLVLLLVRLVRGRTSGRRFVAGFVVLLLLLLGSSFELFLDFTLLLGIGIVLAAAAGPWPRRLMVRAAGLVALAYALCAPVLAGIAFVALTSPHGPLTHVPSGFAIDVLNVVVPTPTLLLGSFHSAQAATEHFVGNVGERDGYLGLPLLLVVALAIRAEWRRGAWLAGALLVAALVLSLGPVLTLGGRPLGGGLDYSQLPVLRDALPARMSLFTALAATCLASLWLARLRRPVSAVVVGSLLVVSLLPNFWAPTVLAGSWGSVSRSFLWATAPVPAGFVNAPGWARLVKPRSTVLVLPTGDRTAAGYWQAKVDMRFALAVPATPFTPPAIDTEPAIRGLVNDDLPRLAGLALGSARLRAFLLGHRIGLVVVTPRARRTWGAVVARATGARPVYLRGAADYRVSRRLRLLRATGDLAVALVAPRQTALASHRRGEPVAMAWLFFDGHRARVRVLALGVHGRPTAVTVSSPRGDADWTAAAVDSAGRAAAAFTEARPPRELLRIATRSNRGWQVATLDSSPQPIWSPQVGIARDGTTFAAWIDEADPTRTVRVSVLPPHGTWGRPVTLENADGLGSVALRTARDSGVLAWTDGVAGESRVRVATYWHGVWSRPMTVASVVEPLVLARVTLVGRNADAVTWRLENPDLRRVSCFEAVRVGQRWKPARRVQPLACRLRR
ncbi:MAG: hypothetical protein WBB76_13125, partial [Gaiellaceae bacterium]